jgi:hypothetical protein
MTAQTATRKKGDRVYRYGWYRCGFARDKGPAICEHGAWYRRESLEGALIAKFREAMTPSIVDAITAAEDAQASILFSGRRGESDRLKDEVLALEQEANNLIEFISAGRKSDLIAAKLHQLESALHERRSQLADLRVSENTVAPVIHRDWVVARLESLDELLRTDPPAARVEMAKHLDGDITIKPLPAPPGQKRAEIFGRVAQNSLLGPQEAVCLQVVAGGRFCYWKQPLRILLREAPNPKPPAPPRRQRGRPKKVGKPAWFTLKEQHISDKRVKH